MQQGQRPRNLRDISHLYLSTSRGEGVEETGPSAMVALASIEGGPLRAWLSAGLAAAFVSQGASVKLLDAGRSLPNAGYYFALSPELYLRPVMDEKAVVEADDGGGIRVMSARDPSLLRYGDDGTGTGLNVIMIAFEWDGVDFPDGSRRLFDSLPPGLPVFLLTVSDCYPVAAEGISRTFREIFPGAPVMALFPSGKEERRGGLEACPFPAGILTGLSRRMPPVSSFLTGLSGEILQRLASCKRGAARDRI
jgi:hypothetical protein